MTRARERDSVGGRGLDTTKEGEKAYSEPIHKYQL